MNVNATYIPAQKNAKNMFVTTPATDVKNIPLLNFQFKTNNLVQIFFANTRKKGDKYEEIYLFVVNGVDCI